MPRSRVGGPHGLNQSAVNWQSWTRKLLLSSSCRAPYNFRFITIQWQSVRLHPSHAWLGTDDRLSRHWSDYHIQALWHMTTAHIWSDTLTRYSVVATGLHQRTAVRHIHQVVQNSLATVICQAPRLTCALRNWVSMFTPDFINFRWHVHRP